MELVTVTVGADAILEASGRIDSITAQSFEERLLGLVKTATAGVIVDLAGIEYISSAGLRVLLIAAKQCKAAHRRFALCSLRPSVRAVFEISGLVAIIDIHPDCVSASSAGR